MHLRKRGRAASVSIRQHTSAYVSVCRTMCVRTGGRAVSIRQHTSAYASVCSTMCVRTGGRAVTSESPHCFLQVFCGPYLCAAAASRSRWPASNCSCCSCGSSRYTPAHVSLAFSSALDTHAWPHAKTHATNDAGRAAHTYAAAASAPCARAKGDRRYADVC